MKYMIGMIAIATFMSFAVAADGEPIGVKSLL